MFFCGQSLITKMSRTQKLIPGVHDQFCPTIAPMQVIESIIRIQNYCSCSYLSCICVLYFDSVLFYHWLTRTEYKIHPEMKLTMSITELLSASSTKSKRKLTSVLSQGLSITQGTALSHWLSYMTTSPKDLILRRWGGCGSGGRAGWPMICGSAV